MPNLTMKKAKPTAKSLMAAVTMTTIPSIMLVVFLQKQLEKGVTLGAFGGR